ncbi:MAG: hypothetical protein JXB00_15125 [Bacteroidales bacterium]|nr:hypothetical protein [Bacteroidales bacterium]
MNKLLPLSAVLAVFAIITLLATKHLYNDDIKKEPGLKCRKIDEVKTEINFLSGTLNIKSETINKLYSGDYNFPRDELKPVITYHEENKTGFLRIISKEPDNTKRFDSSDNNVWDLKLNKNIPTELYIKMVAGEGKINLAESMLNRLDFQMVAGDVEINLRNTSITDLNIKAIAGKVTLDLTGKWNDNLRASITGGAGELLLLIPETTGAQVEITGLLANIFTPGFEKNGNSYTNASFGNTKETLHIDIFGGIGDVELRMIRE